MNDITVEDLISFYGLKPHPEGGFFKETYRDEALISKDALSHRFNGDRNISTAIYYLLPEGKKSALHRIKSDEIWHFYCGGPITIVHFSEKNSLKEIVLGNNIKSGGLFQYVVPAGNWFGAYPNRDSKFSFVGCTVAPGFDFSDFELGKRDKLINLFPKYCDIITKLTD